MLFRSFQSALFDAGISTNPDIFAEVEPTDVENIEKILNKFQPDAIMCSNDGYAHKLVDTLELIGKSVPRDIMVAGFDNTSSYSKNKLQLTSIKQPLDDICEEAIYQMFRRLEHPDRNKTIIRLPGKLVIRQSTTKWEI